MPWAKLALTNKIITRSSLTSMQNLFKQNPRVQIQVSNHGYKSRFLQMLHQGEVCALKTQKASVLILTMNKTQPPRACDLVSDPLCKRTASRNGRVVGRVGQGAVAEETRDLPLPGLPPSHCMVRESLYLPKTQFLYLCQLLPLIRSQETSYVKDQTVNI